MESTDIDAIERLRTEAISKVLSEKEKGRKVIGSYCTYCPRELILAAGAVPFGLCGTKEVPDEVDLPRNLCPLVKSSYGLAVTDKCPYFLLSDLVIAETTCDGKKKMYEILKTKGIKDIYVMQLPQMPDSPESVGIWVEELKKARAYIENAFGITITDDDLREAIHTTNEEHRCRKRLYDLNQRKPAVLTGIDMLHIMGNIPFVGDPKEAIRIIDSIVDEPEAQADSADTTYRLPEKRILLTGTPVGIGSEKVISLVEECGGTVVVMETCGGYKTLNLSIDETDLSDPLLAMAKRYMKIPCSVMTPNDDRIALLRNMVRDFQIDGVIDLTWQACLTYSVESFFTGKLINDELGLPFLQIETDYSKSDIETLRVRIEAFLEMIDAG